MVDFRDNTEKLSLHLAAFIGAFITPTFVVNFRYLSEPYGANILTGNI